MIDRGGSGRRGDAPDGESPRSASRLPKTTLLVLAGIALLLACEALQSPTSDAPAGVGTIAVSASYTSTTSSAEATALAAAYDSADRVAVRLVEPGTDSAAVDLVRSFDPSDETAEVRVETPLEGTRASFLLQLELRNGEQPLLAADTTVTLRAGTTVSTEVRLLLVGDVGGSRLEGRVVAAQGETGLAGVTVRFEGAGQGSLRLGDRSSAVGETTTDSAGNWTSPPLTPGTYDVRFEHPDRENTVLFGAEAVDGERRSVGRVPLVPASEQVGTAAGRVFNARNDSSIADATVELREGVRNTSGTVVDSAVTDSTGAYRFAERAAGTYTITADAPDFAVGSRTVVAVGGESVPDQGLALSPRGAGDVRIVLTWGETPEDLDAHLTGPDSAGGRFHVYWNNRGSLDSNPYAALDRDDVTSFGPETITISRLRAGTYRYSVHDFTNRSASTDSPSTALAESGAKVELFIEDTLAAEYFPPSEDGTLWTVFEVRDSSIVRVDTMGYESNSTAVTSVLPGSRGVSKTVSADSAGKD